MIPALPCMSLRFAGPERGGGPDRSARATEEGRHPEARRRGIFGILVPGRRRRGQPNGSVQPQPSTSAHTSPSIKLDGREPPHPLVTGCRAPCARAGGFSNSGGRTNGRHARPYTSGGAARCPRATTQCRLVLTTVRYHPGIRHPSPIQSGLAQLATRVGITGHHSPAALFSTFVAPAQRRSPPASTRRRRSRRTCCCPWCATLSWPPSRSSRGRPPGSSLL